MNPIFLSWVLGMMLCAMSCCHLPGQTVKGEAEVAQILNGGSKKISVLNVGTFHMGRTSDAYSSEFDEHDEDNVKAVHAIAQKLAAFKPTVILVEQVPEHNEQLQADYAKYVADPSLRFKHPSEIELLAFELGRLSGTKRIYGIDHKLSYTWNIYTQFQNQIDSTTILNLIQKIPQLFAAEAELPLEEKLALINTDPYLDLTITGNADMLTHAGTDGNFEGADEAAKYYQRNLRMYSNLNRIELDEDDRVFILMGASHTAFFRDFMSRSSKYEMVNTFDYLK